MKCPKCGANLREGATFCPSCGSPTQPQRKNYVDYRNGGSYNGGSYNRGGYNHNNGRGSGSSTLIAAIIAIGAVLFVIIALFVTMAAAEIGPFKPEPTPTPVPTATPEPTPVPEPTTHVVYVETVRTAPPKTSSNTASNSGKNTNQNTNANQGIGTGTAIVDDADAGVVKKPSYKRYSSSKYGYSINYPTHFSVYDDGLGEATLYTVRSSDGSAKEIIAAAPVTGETVSSSLNSFIASHSGTVTYKTSGNDYYAACIKSGAVEYYKYCKFKNGNMYWFEFVSPSAQHEIYDVYINDIYNSISID